MKNKKMYNLFLISLVFLVYFLVSLGLYVFQRNLLYHPTENNYSGDKLTVNIEKVKITTEDNIDLLAWYHKKNNNKNTAKITLFDNYNISMHFLHTLQVFPIKTFNFRKVNPYINL